MSLIAATPKPPYYAVIFTSKLTDDNDGFKQIADKMLTLSSKQTGFLGVESAREELGITTSYWKDLKSIKAWKNNAEHLIAQQKGRDIWYQNFKIRIAKVERDYGFEKS